MSENQLAEKVHSERMQRYLAGVQESRDGLKKTTFFRELTSGNPRPDQVWCFWLLYCEYGTDFTAPVEEWIKGAGEACLKAKFTNLGISLKKHSKQESGHDKMLRRDLRGISAALRKQGKGALVDCLPSLPRKTPGIVKYLALHNDNIFGNPEMAFVQPAIQLEIEGMSGRLGPMISEATEKICPGLTAELTFVTDHINIDKQHTHSNNEMLDAYLGEHGNDEREALLIAAGKAANEAYGCIFDDIWGLAGKLVAAN